MSWISIKDEKPNIDTKVLVYLETRGPLVAVLMNVDKSPALQWWAIFSNGAHPIDAPHLISHWRPLPKSPAEEGIEEQATVVYPLSDFQKEELRTAFRYALPYCTRGIEIHRIGFTNRSLLLMEVKYDGYFKTLAIPRDGETSLVGEVLFPIR
jgi:hypothetical protein